MKSRYIAGRFAITLAIAALTTLLAASFAHPAGAGANREIDCLALTIYHEARGESASGKLAVGQVVMNRTRNALFPTSVCAVVRQGGQQRHRCQFSWWCDGRSDRPKDSVALRESLPLAEAIYFGCVGDPTAGALWYHATGVKPGWSRSMGKAKRIGRHVFYRGEQDAPLRVSASKTISQTCRRVGPSRTVAQIAGS
jgi:spore germination cell wall hydrolase CwlJ-like protein